MLAHGLATQGFRVLLVEDSHREAQMTRQQIEAVDDELTIHRVGTLREAQDYLAHEKTDAVVLDLGLPDSVGTQALRTITRQFPDMAVVVLSGQTSALAMAKVFEGGAQEFLLKGECSGKMIRQAILSAMFRKSMEQPA